ncbi:hypothetical protein AGMMS49525_17250 [Bacteroidia bacterium]|nr:hypothetical protein AGMMS49525_17250 [Bacteroidia bacterium]
MELSNILTRVYNTGNYLLLLHSIFGENFRALSNPEKFGVDNKMAKNALQLGEITLSDGNILAVYEVELQDHIHVAQNRVAIRNLCRTYWNKYDGAFIASYQLLPCGGIEGGCWRFTFVSETRQWNDDGTRYEKAVTDAKRFTYLLGENETARTAKERFTELKSRGVAHNAPTLDDVKDAFEVEKLSKDFFATYKQHYIRFCDHLLNSPSCRIALFKANDKAIRDFCKKLLGRIVFLYFLQKKGWLGAKDLKYKDGDKNFMSNLFRKYTENSTSGGDLFYSQCLTKLFFETLNQARENDNFTMPNGETVKIPFLNGGLFEDDRHCGLDPQSHEKKRMMEFLDFPSSLFTDLFTFFDQYNFTIYEDDPNDHTVAVDPEMLGHIFENLLEDNKDKGAYYTPKEIVHYMCQESLKEYLKTCLNHDSDKINEIDKILDCIFSRGNLENLTEIKVQDNMLQAIHKALDNVKICDPAIGSGAFPMGLLQEIFSAKQTLHHFQHSSLEGFKAADVKLNIIQNSIYGVDIERGAVDIARLRFWLSLIIDEEVPTPLPNLDYKIVVGNSLVSKFEDEVIDIDWTIKDEERQTNIFGSGDLMTNNSNLLNEISEKQKAYFNPKSDKKKLAPEIRNLKIDLLINQLNLMISKNKDFESTPQRTNVQLILTSRIFFVPLPPKTSYGKVSDKINKRRGFGTSKNREQGVSQYTNLPSSLCFAQCR